MKLDNLSWLPLAAIVTGFFALKQIRSNNITNARIKWLDNLKTLIADFFAECDTLTYKEVASFGVNERRKLDPKNETAQKLHDDLSLELIDALRIIAIKHDLIKLNLNPKEPLHIKFEKLLDGYMGIFNTIPKTKKDSEDFKMIARNLNKHSEVLLLLARFICKLEWEKTKRGFLSRAWFFKIGKGNQLLREALALEIKS